MRTIEIAGTRYPLLVDVNVIAKIQERYGSVNDLWEELSKLSETVWVLTQLINEADRYQRVFEGKGTLQEPMTEEKLGMLMTFDDLTNQNLAQVIIDTFNDGMSGRKNQPAGQSEKRPRSGKRKRKKKKKQ